MNINAAKTQRALLLLVPVVLAVAVTMAFVNRDGAKRSLDVRAEEPTFTTLQDLVRAADLVVVARATEVHDGRTVASGTGTRSAIRTQLASLEVGDVLDGKTDQHLTLEQELTLADGTPIIVNGVAPLKPNDEGLLFLVRSADTSAPYVAVVNTQSRYLVSGAQRDQLTPSGKDPLSTQLAALGPYELRCAVLAAGDTGRAC
jgi:hypothetical protein